MGLGGDAGEREKGWQMKNINASSKKSICFFHKQGGKKTTECMCVCLFVYIPTMTAKLLLTVFAGVEPVDSSLPSTELLHPGSIPTVS